MIAAMLSGRRSGTWCSPKSNLGPEQPLASVLVIGLAADNLRVWQAFLLRIHGMLGGCNNVGFFAVSLQLHQLDSAVRSVRLIAVSKVPADAAVRELSLTSVLSVDIEPRPFLLWCAPHLARIRTHRSYTGDALVVDSIVIQGESIHYRPLVPPIYSYDA